MLLIRAFSDSTDFEDAIRKEYKSLRYMMRRSFRSDFNFQP